MQDTNMATNLGLTAADAISDLGSRLDRQCCLGDGPDVCFLVGDGERRHRFYAHRSVLAAGSPVFKHLLSGPTAAACASTDGIVVHDVAPGTFRALMRFMYTDALPRDDEVEGASSTEMLQSLVAAAGAYGVDKLKLACARELCGRVSVQNVVATLGLAEAHGCPELKNRCMDFLAEGDNFSRVVVCSLAYVPIVA